MSRISEIYTVAPITQTGATVLNPLKTYIDVSTEVTDKLTEDNIADTVDSLFFMQCGDKTPFTKSLKINYNSSTKEFTEETFDCITKMSIGRTNQASGYYNNALDWNYNAQGLMSRVHDDMNLYNLKGFKRTYPDSCMLGGYPLSNYEYRTPRLSVRIYYIDPTTTQYANNLSTYTTPYDFITNKSKQGYVCNSIMLYYTGFSNPSLMMSQEIKGTSDGTVKTFSIPYSNNVYFHFYQDTALQFSGLDFTNKEYFDERIHVGTAYNHNNYVYPIKPEKILNFIASFGFIFTGEFTKNTTQTFYPEVNSGIITGNYFENIDDWKSDNSTWENTDDINRPKPDKNLDDDTESMKIGYGFGLGGFCKYLYFSSSDILELFINHLSHEISNPTSAVVSCSSYPISLKSPVNNFITTSEETVYGYNVQVVKNQLPRVSLGKISIPDLHGNFLDNAPYTTYELYIPLCGWTTLPDKVHGTTIYVYLTYDVISTSCKAIVQSVINGELVTVAEKSGKLGTSEIISATDNVSKQTAIVGALLNTTGASVGLATSVATGNVLGGIASGLSLGSAISQDLALSHNNYTSATGCTGDRSDFANSHECYLKIVTVSDTPPDNYNHTVGRPCNKSGTLSDFSGYTVCTNVDVSGLTCSDTEKQKIKSLLENGVYC